MASRFAGHTETIWFFGTAAGASSFLMRVERAAPSVSGLAVAFWDSFLEGEPVASSSGPFRDIVSTQFPVLSHFLFDVSGVVSTVCSCRLTDTCLVRAGVGAWGAPGGDCFAAQEWVTVRDPGREGDWH